MTIGIHKPYERPLGRHPTSGRPVSVRTGRFGPFVQIGTRDDEVMPEWRLLEDDQCMYTIQLPEALDLFRLPRSLGNLPTGEAVIASTGQYGPYLKFDSTSTSGAPPRTIYIALTRHDPLMITLAEATSIVQAHRRRRQFRVIRGGLDATGQPNQTDADVESQPEGDA